MLHRSYLYIFAGSTIIVTAYIYWRKKYDR
jgi:hypothetical protein